MKKYIYLLIVLLALPSLLTSCMKDDDEVELSDRCYISALSLGSLKRTIYVKDDYGKDTTNTVVFAGSLYPMTIDQRTLGEDGNLLIENKDSLPTGTRLDAVLVTAKFDAALLWRKAKLEADEDTTWHAFSEKDSMDLRQPVHLYCLAANGLSHRIYTLKVNVHQQKGDSTVWTSMGRNEQLAAAKQTRMMVWNNQLLLLTDQVSYTRTLDTETTWTEGGSTQDIDVTSVQTLGDKLYASNAAGEVMQSADGKSWTQSQYPACDGLRLVAAGDDKLYALCNGLLMSSDGSDWTEELLDDVAANLPTAHLNKVLYTMPDGRRRLLLLGSKVTDGVEDSKATIWAKEWRGTSEAAAQWIYYTPNGADKLRCPVMDNLQILPYDNGLIALGDTLGSVLYSRDHGITWVDYDKGEMDVDRALQLAAKNGSTLTATTTDTHHLWVLTDGELWRGRINRLGFLRQDRK